MELCSYLEPCFHGLRPFLRVSLEVKLREFSRTRVSVLQEAPTHEDETALGPDFFEPRRQVDHIRIWRLVDPPAGRKQATRNVDKRCIEALVVKPDWYTRDCRVTRSRSFIAVRGVKSFERHHQMGQQIKHMPFSVSGEGADLQ